MTNEQFVKKFGEEYSSLLEEASKFNYEVNEEQFAKLLDLVKFFKEYIKENGGSAEPVNLDPREIHSGLTVSFVVFNITGDEIQKFCDVVKNTTALSIDATNDEKVCISMTIPDVFRKI